MLIITKISLAAFILVTIAMAAKALGVLDKRYSDMIMLGALALQTIILGLLIIILIMKRRKLHGVKIIRYQLHDIFVKGDTNILSDNVSPTNPRKSALFKIFLEIENISETPEIGISKIGSGRVIPNIKDHIININSGMVNNNFIFDADIIVGPNEKINFRIKKDTVVKLFFLGEFYIP